MSSRRHERAQLAPLMLATMASQALLVVLAPTIVAVGIDLGASVGAVGQARAITAVVAIVASVAIASRIDALAISRLIAVGAVLAVSACAAIAAAPSLVPFLLAHVLVGVALACLLSAGFAGVAAFPAERRGWAIGHVASANAIAWIVVTPVVGIMAARFSWRSAQAVPAALAVAALVVAPAAVTAAGGASIPRLRTLFARGSARRWLGTEVMAYGAWASLLTFVGAYFVESLGVREAVVGWLLACGAAAYVLASTRYVRLAAAFPRRQLIAWVASAMAVLFVVLLAVARTPAAGVFVFCLIGLGAGLRTPASSSLGLTQLPGHPGAMMAARTAATQSGYLLGAVVGGMVIALEGYAAYGFVLAASMAASALLVLRVEDAPEGAPATADAPSDA